MPIKLFFFPTQDRPRPTNHYYCLMMIESNDDIVNGIVATILDQADVDVGSVETIEDLCRALNVSIDIEGHKYKYAKQWIIIRDNGILCKMAPKVDMDKPRLHGGFIFEADDDIFEYI